MPSHSPTPFRKIVIDPTAAADEVQYVTSQLDIWKRENAVDTARIILADTQFDHYENTVTYNDDVAIYLNYKEATSTLTASDLRFYGFIENISPYESESGQFTAITLKHYGRCLLDMLCGQEYGSESSNSGLDTIAEILQDNTNGVVDLWVNKILGGAANSGYSLNDTLIEAIAGAIRYIQSPYDTVKATIDTCVNYVQAIKGAAAGPHYIVHTVETGGPTFTTYLLLTTVGAHSAGPPDVAATWPTWWRTNQAGSTITVREDQVTSNFVKQRQEANYILYQGAFRKPLDGDAWTENSSGSWGTSGHMSLVCNDDNTVPKVGSWDINIADAGVAQQEYAFYPSTEDWSYDFTKIAGQYTPATLNFYARYASIAAPTNIRVQMRSNNVAGADYYYVNLYPDLLPRSNIWFYISLPLGDFDTNPRVIEAFPSFEGWIPSGGAETWADIDCVEFSFFSGVGNILSLKIDGLTLGGYVLRGAKKAAQSYYKVKPITDNIAKDDTLKSGTPGTTDIGTLGRLAYAELLRASSTPVTGQIQTPAVVDLLAGQQVHIHACRLSDGTYGINADFRVTEHHLSLNNLGFFSTLTLTSDLLNGIPQPTVMDEYNNMLKYVNPMSQTRQISSVKMAKMDITQAILEESY